MNLISEKEYKALNYLISQSTDVSTSRSYNNGEHYGALQSLETKGYIKTDMAIHIMGKMHQLGSTYWITGEGFHAYYLYKDQKHWFTLKYVVSQILVPIAIAVTTTFLTRLLW